MPTQFIPRLWPKVLALVLLAVVLASSSSAVAQVGIPGRGQLGRDSIPSIAYFRAIEELYEGDYQSAERTFLREIRSSIKIGVANRWIDSIAYHSMLGEVYYHQGRLAEALEQFDQACLMFLQYPNWMIRVQFQREPRVDANRLRRILPWGKSGRQFTLGRFPSQELIQIVEVARQALRQGATPGYQAQLPFRKLNVIEIVRATSLAIRRRNELLGPLGAEDTISGEFSRQHDPQSLVKSLGKPAARPGTSGRRQNSPSRKASQASHAHTWSVRSSTDMCCPFRARQAETGSWRSGCCRGFARRSELFGLLLSSRSL